RAGVPCVHGSIPVAALVQERGGGRPVSGLEALDDPAAGVQADDRRIGHGVVELTQLAEDAVHAMRVVEVRGRLAEEIERVVVALVAALVLAAEASLEGALGGGLDWVVGAHSRTLSGSSASPLPA